MAFEIFRLVGTILINAGNAEETIDSVVSSAQEAGAALSQAGQQANNAGRQIGKNGTFSAGSVWLGNTLTKLTAKAVSFGKNLISSGFEYNSQIEQLTVDFSTMMDGNTEAAESLVAELQQLAKVTPMETLGLAKTANLLMGYGTSAEDVIATLTMLGDVAGGSQEKLNSIALAYGQAMAAGKLNAQDANQMITAGFPVWTKLAEYLNLSVADVRKLSEEGGVTADVLNGMFKSITSEGGQYYGKMEAQSKTYAGQLSTMQDLADQSKGALTNPFFEVASSNVFPSLTTLFENFTTWCIENKDQLSELAATVGDFVVNSLTAILDLFKWITENGESFNTMLLLLAGGFTAIQIAVNPMKGIFLAIAEAGLLVFANWEKIKKLWEGITQAIDNAIVSLQKFFGINGGSGVGQGSSGVLHGGGNGSFESNAPVSTEAFTGSSSLDFWGIPGAATGLDRVPYDNYLVRLHKDESVLNATNAAIWRRGGGVGDTSRLEGLMQQLLGTMNQVVSNTANGHTIQLDSGILVGSLLPAIDTGLGTFASRKERGI